MCDHQNIFEWHNKFWNCNQTLKKIMSSFSSLILICMHDYQHSTEHRFVVILIDFYQSIDVFKEKSWVFLYSKEWVDLMSDVNISKTLYSQYTQKYKLPLFKKTFLCWGHLLKILPFHSVSVCIMAHSPTKIHMKTVNWAVTISFICNSIISGNLLFCAFCEVAMCCKDETDVRELLHIR